MNLKNKKILIVGAGADIGISIAKAVIREGSFAVLVDDNIENLNHSFSEYLEDSYKIHHHNILEIGLTEDLISSLVADYGKFDGFVYCAGHGGIRPLTFNKPEFMQEMMNVNFYPFVEFARFLSKKKHFNSGGSIVAISSISSVKGFKSKLAYGASKAALDAAVRGLAAELGERKIRVNSILKGIMTVDNQHQHVKNMFELGGAESGTKQILGETDPEELANLVSFLLSDAVKTMTGVSLLLDGGYSL